MELSKLLNNVQSVQVSGFPENIDTEGITINSKEANEETIFVAITGFKTDGHKYIPEALSKGAKVVVIEKDSSNIDELVKINNAVKILVKDSRKALAQLSNALYDYPSTKLNLIGITGTKGKTTTSYYIKNILEKSGRNVGLIGTNKNMVGYKVIPTKLTTPESNVINSLMSKMVYESCSDCVMEVSSHSIELSRVDGLDFNIAVFTNITSDHLDFHDSFENYLSAKKKLFDMIGQSAHIVYNIDDIHHEKLLKDCSATQISFGINGNADFKISDIYYDLNGTRYNLNYNGKDYKVSTSLIGKFNAYNSVSAIAASVLSNVEIEVAIEGIESTPQVPGRFEVLGIGDKKVIIDYSHTSDSLKQALEAIRFIVNDSQPVYTVFGCGGDRDKTKRPEMGSIAEEYSDYCIITSDNPRTENPLAIIEDIKRGFKSANYKVIEDREEAIKYAIEKSEDNAVILIAGKGHETYQEINGVRNHFSDKEVTEKYL